MRIIYPVIFGAVMIAIFGIIEILLMRTLNRRWWNNKFIRRAAIGLPLVGVIAILAWFGGFYQGIWFIFKAGSTATAAILVLLLALMFSLPISGFFNWILHRQEIKQGSAGADESYDPRRRSFLKSAAAALPVTAVAMSVGGVGRAFGDTEIEIKDIVFDNLPPALNGFKILHLTDSHIGIYKFVEDLEEILARAEGYGPDLVLYTGDIADNLPHLPDALKLVSQLKARHGHFACLGNHEYYRGIKRVVEIFDESDVPLLRSSGVVIEKGEVKILVAGADDPVTMREDPRPFLQQSIDQALANQPETDFKILMCHRPEGFGPAAGSKIDLVLSGHTHGGQVGFNGRSIFDMFMPDRYLWGEYKIGGSRMYLSSGIGHWFPFRLGCPSEAPIIKLTTNG